MEGPSAAAPAAGATAPATSKKEDSSSEELVADEPARGLRSATQVLRQFKAVSHVAPPDATLAAPSGEAQVVPDAEPDGSYLCPECGKGLDTVVRWHLHRAACHEILLLRAVFPEPTNTDQLRQDYRGVWFKLSREGHYFEMNEPNRARTARKLGGDVVVPLLEPVPTFGGGRRGMEMRDDPDEQEQVRRLRERGSHAVNVPKAGPPKKGGRNKAPSTFGAGAYHSEAALWPTGRGAGRRCRVYRWSGLEIQPQAVLQLGFLGVLFLQRGQSPGSR